MPSPARRQEVEHKGCTWCHRVKVGEICEDYAALFSSAYLYICGSSGQNLHIEKQFVYSNGLLQIQKEDNFYSAPKLFYDVK